MRAEHNHSLHLTGAGQACSLLSAGQMPRQVSEALCRYVSSVDSERYALNRTVVRHRKPMIEGAMNGMEAYLTVIVPGETPCLQCIYPQIPDWWSWAEFAALGAVPGMVGCMAAVEAIKVITGFGKPLMNSLLAFDAESHEYKKFKLHRSPNCPVCAHL